MSEMNYRCRNCNLTFEIKFEMTPLIPARTYGPPENCEPESGGEFTLISPEECPECKTKVDEEIAQQGAVDKASERDYEDYDC